ncbi:DUF4956 domain-containing protein [Mobilitalea sibirica]|uniref:DUF4956 domain-containing protein n=2 Tax=Mobilitalea sibirica TaxID=1462919 RepID=A0A8J7HAY7_9FIRM|nr:DUF4956 domain-containing protein [Mobilitalea sibirica]MBH1940466.1 DUF4956 domain-containing protein [Mobilitalea sibirica]
MTVGISLNISSTLLSIIVGLFLGLIISIVYLLITPRNDRSPNFAVSLVVLPAIVTVIILLVGGNLARAFSLAGVFTLVRFRSVPGDSKDITFVFFAMAAGLTSGMGYLTLGAAITILLCFVFVVFHKIGFGVMKQKEKRLRITIPEDMNFEGAFDDLFEKYTNGWSMQKVRTSNLGTLYEITYHIILKEKVSEKEFIDELRCRNGNLNIMLSMMETNSQQF